MNKLIDTVLLPLSSIWANKLLPFMMVLWQMLIESTTLSIVGGMLATLLGFSVALVVAGLSPLPAASQPPPQCSASA